MTNYPEHYPLEVLQKVAVTPCINPAHKTAVEFDDPRITGAEITILCADCCSEQLAELRKVAARG